MSRPRRSMKSKPQVDAMEQRLVLSQATAAPVAQAIAHRPPAMIQQRIDARPPVQAQPLVQTQPQAQNQAHVRLRMLADAQARRQEAANQVPDERLAARAAQREAARIQMEQRRERAKEHREQQGEADPAPTTSTYKIQADSSDRGFSFKKIWKSLFSW